MVDRVCCQKNKTYFEKNFIRIKKEECNLQGIGLIVLGDFFLEGQTKIINPEKDENGFSFVMEGS